MPQYPTKSPLKLLREHATNMAQRGVPGTKGSGPANGTTASPPGPSGGTETDDDGYATWPFCLGEDTLGDTRAYLQVNGDS